MKLISNIISVLAFSGAAVATQAAERPNVIIVFIDDFGYGDLGCYGSTKHRTPHIDQMAKEGIRLTDFYVGSSVSTPSRSALLTGCYPRRVSMHVNADPNGYSGYRTWYATVFNMKIARTNATQSHSYDSVP